MNFPDKESFYLLPHKASFIPVQNIPFSQPAGPCTDILTNSIVKTDCLVFSTPGEQVCWKKVISSLMKAILADDTIAISLLTRHTAAVCSTTQNKFTLGASTNAPGSISIFSLASHIVSYLRYAWVGKQPIYDGDLVKDVTQFIDLTHTHTHTHTPSLRPPLVLASPRCRKH